MCKNVSISVIYNFLKQETPKISINNRMDIKIVFHASRDIPYSKNEQTATTTQTNLLNLEWNDRAIFKGGHSTGVHFIKFKTRKSHL